MARVAVTLLVLLIVVTTTLIQLSHLSRVVVQEALRQAELISRQIYAQTSRTLARAPGSHPQEALKRDPELRAAMGRQGRMKALLSLSASSAMSLREALSWASV